MKTIEGNIIDIVKKEIFKGRILFDNKIVKIERDNSIINEQYILPGLVDAHVHIESSMLTPLEYSKIATKHGVVAAITDPHEIANVCGMAGINFMTESARETPMKIFTGAPSCVPATSFETSGAIISSKEIETLLSSGQCTHLSEMMNFPGVIYNDKEVEAKLAIAKKHNKVIDGHAPLLTNEDLKKYIQAGISTDHECTNLKEAKEKIALGMKIMLRESSAAKDFDTLMPLIETNPEAAMLCTDDCHPDDLEKGYINLLVKRALKEGYNIFNVLTAATKTAIEHYKLNIGLVQEKDDADFIVITNLNDFTILSTFIEGQEVYNGKEILIKNSNKNTINNFYTNEITTEDICVKYTSGSINVIQIVPDSLLTHKINYKLEAKTEAIISNTNVDILKIVVLNRYAKAKPSIGFIQGFGLKHGAIAGSIAHDSHNICAVGTSDEEIIKAIKEVQKTQGGLVIVNGNETYKLNLPIAGLMADKDCTSVAKEYKTLSGQAKKLGCTLHAPFMTLAFMSLLVVPELKLSDKGLFDVSKFDFIKLQN